MQTYELKDNTIDQYIVICPEKQIIAALAKEESYAFQQHGSQTNIDATTQTPDQRLLAYNGIKNSSLNTVVNSPITATDYIGAFTYKVPTIIDPLYADFKVLNIQTYQFASLDPKIETESLWEDLYPEGDNDKLGVLFNGNQLLRIPSNRFNNTTAETTVSVQVIIKQGSEVIQLSPESYINSKSMLSVNMLLSINTEGNNYYFDKTKSVKIIGMGGDKIILSEPALQSTPEVVSYSILVFNLNESVEKNYGKYYLKISPKYVDFKVNTINYGEHNSQDDIALKPKTDVTNKEFNRTTNYNLSLMSKLVNNEDKNAEVWDLWNFNAYPNMDGRLLGSICEIKDVTGKIKGQKIIGENTYNQTVSPVEINITLHPDLIGTNADTTTETTYSDLPEVGDTIRIYLKETYFDPIFVEINYISGITFSDLAAFLMNDAVRDVKTGIMEIYDDNGTIINNGAVDGKVIQNYQFSLQNNLEIRHKINKE